MNVIKLKDIIMPNEYPYAEYFNKYLKGKYAYWVQMRYIVSFEHMRHEGYVACEEDITKLLQNEQGVYPKPYGAPSLDIYKDNVIQYVDTYETDKVNSVMEYRLKNKFSPDSDITTDELKRFRTWLAESLLLMDKNDKGEQRKMYFSEEEIHVLDYYANDMYNSTIKILDTFGGYEVKLNDITKSTCGCGNADLSSLYNTSLNVCSPIDVYRKGVFNKMVLMFSDINFWTKWSDAFMMDFKKYIDNIIKADFVLTKSSWLSEFNDCGCVNKDEQEKLMEILKRLSISLGYIIDNQVNGHKNYINDALYDWSNLLYENMKW